MAKVAPGFCLLVVTLSASSISTGVPAGTRQQAWRACARVAASACAAPKPRAAMPIQSALEAIAARAADEVRIRLLRRKAAGFNAARR